MILSVDLLNISDLSNLIYIFIFERIDLMLEAVTTGITTVISWVGSVVDSLLGESAELSALLPLFAIGVSISAILLGVRIIKSFIWGS